MNHLPETLERLSARVEALEQRVHDFETLEKRVHNLEQFSQPSLPTPDEALDPLTPPPPTELASSEQISSIFLVLGKALLGIAGAYLLRALEEFAILPRLAIAAVAILYAIAWLVAASRTEPRQRFAAILYAGTSALILAPMLWELNLHFHVLSAPASAAVLGLYLAVAKVRAWRRDASPEDAIASATVGLTALALSIVTHIMLPFLALLLVMVTVCEYRTARGKRDHTRILIAAVADCAVWIVLVLYRMPAAARTDYPALPTAVLIAAPCLLFLLTASSVVYRTALLHCRITAFESIQAVIAFLLAACSPLLLIPDSSPRIIGVLCLAFAAACYAAAFAIFRRAAEPRNFRVFALWSAALTLAGAFLILPQSWAASALAVVGLVCILAAAKLACLTLESHGAVYLAVAGSASGLLAYAFQSLAGVMPSTATVSMLLVSGCALLGYSAAPECEGETWLAQGLHLFLAALAVCALAAFLTRGSLALLALMVTPGVFHIALLRTLTLCAVALALSFAGARWRRLEMRRIAYAVLAFLAAKLLFEDLRHGHLGFIAGSIFLFALTLIAVPRLARVRQQGVGNLRISR